MWLSQVWTCGQDVSTTPAGVVCQNGGTPRATDTGQCDCPLPYAGETCERYIRGKDARYVCKFVSVPQLK